jgi:hypothetical protein
MSKHTYIRTKDGKRVAEWEAVDKQGHLLDGFTLRTSVTMIDGVPSTMLDKDDPRLLDGPQNGGLTHAQRARLCDIYETRISNAWRSPQSQPASSPAARPATKTTDQVYASYDKRLMEAWRTPRP